MIQTATLSLQEAIRSGKSLRDAGDLQGAESVFREISEKLPANPAGWVGLGQVLLDQFRATESIEALGEAMLRLGQSASLHHAMGVALSLAGRIGEAEQHYREAIALEPQRAEFYHSYARAKVFVEADGLHLRIEQLLNNATLTLADRCQLHFAAGKVYDDLGLYNTAFDHFQRGNRMKGAVYDRDRWNRLVDRSIEFFDRSTLKALRPRHESASTLVFVVGMPRSGTTLIEQIASAHTNVFGAGELNDLNLMSAQLAAQAGSEKPYPECITGVTDETFAALAQQYLFKRASECSSSTATVYCDKTPNNFFFIGLVHALFRNVRIVHCRRNPLDTLLSCYMTNFGVGQEYSYDLENLAHYYAGYRRMMGHWVSVSSIPILEMDYESLVLSQESESRRLIEFLGLDWQPACLEFQKNERIVATASNWQVRQPIYQRSLKRWKRYCEQVQPLANELARIGVSSTG